MRAITTSVSSNARRRRHDDDLKNGYPIARGVIEGACRHDVSDRMERSGMRRTKAGTRAMSDIRGEFLNGNGDQFQAHRIKVETKRMYPNGEVVKQIGWPLVA